jgi:CheY-like chemotaxis protein
MTMMCAFSSAPCWACAAASVIEAADGEDAVQLAEQDCPDLILMDGSLPRLDGLSATRRIRQLSDCGHVPILFISGHTESSFQAQAQTAGCNEYLVKPLDPDQLSRVLEKYLGQQRAAGAA